MQRPFAVSIPPAEGGQLWEGTIQTVASSAGSHNTYTWVDITGSGTLLGVANWSTGTHTLAIQVDGGPIHEFYLFGRSSSNYAMAQLILNWAFTQSLKITTTNSSGGTSTGLQYHLD